MVASLIYLGNSLVFRKNKLKEFSKLKDRMQKGFQGWSQQLLSKAGKATLIKLVVQAIQTYTMDNFKVPKGIC